MLTKKFRINNKIPTIIWGEESDKAYLFVHGKMSSKEAAENFANIAEQKGYQTISFDLPQHGERIYESDRCDIWNGVRDLSVVGDYVFENWKEVSLFGCSVGAYFSLNVYNTYDIKKCLFQSPVLDMEYLIKQMMTWFDVSEELLEREQEVDTPIDILSWEYYQYVLEHPVEKWSVPTSILYGGKDNLQSLEVVKNFMDRFSCRLTVAEDSEHSFIGDEDIVEEWLFGNI